MIGFRLFIFFVAALAVGACSNYGIGSRVPLDPQYAGYHYAGMPITRVDSENPLNGNVALEPVQDMPGHVQYMLMNVVSDDEFNESLEKALVMTGVIADDPALARYHVVPRYVDVKFPFKIAFTHSSTAIFAYSLIDTETGETVFDRTISITQEATGAEDATSRMIGAGRAAVLANIVSFGACLGRFDGTKLPEICRTQIQGVYSSRGY